MFYILSKTVVKIKQPTSSKERAHILLPCVGFRACVASEIR